MRRFRFKKIDAFTGEHSPGNPAGCIYLKSISDITDAEMLEIARQLKGFVSEVAYVFPEGEGFFLRYFSSEREVDFCGHATIATMFDIFSSDSAMQNRSETVVRVGSSSLAVMNELGSSGSVFIASPEPRFMPMKIRIDDIVRELYISVADIDKNFSVSLVNSGLNSLLVPMRTASALTFVKPGMEGLTDFCVENDVDIVVLFTSDRILPGSQYRTRVFAPRFGYMEDPATGSGNAALGNWLLKEGFWKGDALTIEQGASYDHPNIIRLNTTMADGRPRVLFGGSATVKIDGWYNLR